VNRIFVCSQLRGSPANPGYAEKYCRYVVEKGGAAFAPHLLYPRFLDDSDADHRAKGIAAGISFLSVCDEVWVFVRNRTISDGMQQEIDIAIMQGIPIRWFAVEGDVIAELKHLPPDEVPEAQMLAFPQQFSDLTQKTFASMVAKLKAGDIFYEDLEDELDQVLGTMKTRDKDLEEEWTNGRTPDID
jgi:hypothetical protein